MSQTPQTSLRLDPLLHPGEWDRFTSMCKTASASDLQAMAPLIEEHVRRSQAAAEANRAVDVETATRIAASLRELLDTISDYTAEQRALLRGAITYFAQREDDEDDLDSVIGFDDDARVLSAVAEALGRPDLIVDIPE